LDEVEEAMYYDIVKQRLEIVEKFERLTDENALEKTLQKYLFEHLWLLDPAWDRVDPPLMEKSIAKILNDKSKPKDRVDIKYRVTGTDHVLVELKRADVVTDSYELAKQVRKYRVPILEHLRGQEGRDVDLQVVCVVGRDLSDWKGSDNGRRESAELLRAGSTKVVTYSHLIRNAKQSYSDYLAASQSIASLRAVVERIENRLASDAAE
ncbi:MAG: hypothetical protein QM582_04960, partial [Micropruina sp.]